MKKYYEKHSYQGKLVSARQLSEITGYSYSNIGVLLRAGYTPEQIVNREHKWKKVTDRKDRKVPLFHFRTIEELCAHLGVSRQLLYWRIAKGKKIEVINGEIQFV